MVGGVVLVRAAVLAVVIKSIISFSLEPALPLA
jgi:hypothetical protein